MYKELNFLWRTLWEKTFLNKKKFILKPATQFAMTLDKIFVESQLF